MPTEASSSHSASASALTRRSLVRVGANAAWAVPAVTLAAAAPALAASGAPSVAATGVTCDAGGAAETRTIGATFTNQNTEPTTALTVMFDCEPQVGTVDTSRAVPSEGWTRVVPAPQDFSVRKVSFVRTGAQLTGSGGAMPSASITFTMPVAPAGPLSNALVGTITVVPVPTPGTGTMGVGALA